MIVPFSQSRVLGTRRTRRTRGTRGTRSSRGALPSLFSLSHRPARQRARLLADLHLGKVLKDDGDDDLVVAPTRISLS